LLDRAPLI